MNPEDPLVQTLPPATDYLTYLTLLEYQLTPDRLPLLHQILQDEKLTTNIGWDLVDLLLPMIPGSTECLQDIARLGNPREVILRVSEALMQLQPEESDDEADFQAGKTLPTHILKFNCLLSMLSVLHSRLQTKSPSRFIATSLQAALEAYTTMPSDESTLALLEFLREISPNKRPAPPPRARSESSVLKVAEKSAPDPEAEVPSQSPSPSADTETLLVRKFIQFGLLELLKSYLLSFSSPMDPGMAWAVRMQEHLHPSLRLPDSSQTQAYVDTKELKERDMTMGRIVALSRDVGISSNDLLTIISRPAAEQPPPLDFEKPPKSPDEIPFERHGSLLLLAARIAGATIFNTGYALPDISVFPDLDQIFTHFLGDSSNVAEIAYGQPQTLLDSLLALTIQAMQPPITPPSSEVDFKDFIIALTACTARQSYGIVRQIPSIIFRSHPSQMTRFKLIRHILEDHNLESLQDSALSWLREEIFNPSSTETIFHDPLYFWLLIQYPFLGIKTAMSDGLLESWISLTQTRDPALQSSLNLYYMILSSPTLRDCLKLESSVPFFQHKVLTPLRQLFRDFEADIPANGGDGLIESAVGEEIRHVGTARSVGLLGFLLDQIEEIIHDVYGPDDSDLKRFSEDEENRLEEIRKETLCWN